MATDSKLKIDFTSGLIFGIFGFLLATILDATGIFGMIANIPTIGLFLGVCMGLFKDKLDI